MSAYDPKRTSPCRAFWSEILSKLGYKLTAHWEERFTLSNGEDTYLTFVQVTDKFASHKYNRRDVGLNHLASTTKGIPSPTAATIITPST
jgi:hypothetical protein